MDMKEKLQELAEAARNVLKKLKVLTNSMK